MITIRSPWLTPEELENPEEEERDKKTSPPQYSPSVFGACPILTRKKSFAPRPLDGSLPTHARIDWTLYLVTCPKPEVAKIKSVGGSRKKAQTSAATEMLKSSAPLLSALIHCPTFCVHYSGAGERHASRSSCA